jgi:GNAT superfamily N-acetyltransferase
MHATQLSPPVVLRPAAPDDEHLLAALLASLSPTSGFHRFLAGVGVPNRALVRGLLRADARHGAILAVQSHAGGLRAAGHACWAVDPAGAADIGVVVADEAQGRGLGTSLFTAAARAAAGAGATTLHLDVHPDNRRLVGALRRRFGGAALAWEQGLLTVDTPLTDVAGVASAA